MRERVQNEEELFEILKALKKVGLDIERVFYDSLVMNYCGRYALDVFQLESHLKSEMRKRDHFYDVGQVSVEEMTVAIYGEDVCQKLKKIMGVTWEYSREGKRQ